MDQFEEIRQKIIATINELPEDKLIKVDGLIRGISSEPSSIETIYNEAKNRYTEALQKLAE